MSDSKRSFSDDERPPTVRKRKYRKHPKPDPNTPKKPSPSAYHLFALEQGEKLRKKGYGFEDIARETGAMWRALSPHAVNNLEAKTTNAKNQYRKDLVAYKKSAEYKAYQEYLKRWMAKEEAKKKQTSYHSTKQPTPPPAKSLTTAALSSPLSSSPATDEMPALDWISTKSSISSASSQSSEIDNTFMNLAEDWFFMPELSTSEQMQWKWSADYGITLIPDPLFPMHQPRAVEVVDTFSTMPISSTIEPSMLTDSGTNLFATNPFAFG